SIVLCTLSIYRDCPVILNYTIKLGSGVTWYYNDIKQTLTNDTWKIGAASPKHSGSYQCESGQRSDMLQFKLPNIASLTIVAGQPVVRTDGSVVLQLEHEDGLNGWKCFVDRGGQTKKIKLKLRNDSLSVVFQPKRLNVPEIIFWCTDTNEQHRSNQITDVSLEMYPLPAVVGESLILKCLAWGTDQISHTVFYKNNSIILEGLRSTYTISDVTESAMGSYKCGATFTHKARTEGPPYKVVSDDQDVFAFLTANTGLSCSCPLCPDSSSYRWYYKNNYQPWALKDYHQWIMPKESGTYACRAVWSDGRSSLSSGYDCEFLLLFLLKVFDIVPPLIYLYTFRAVNSV
uniref:Ig-like domain-containing protein n=1 Tax=Sander lucioperca TaxID=283035 RepID=A0A8D0D484_SANLU